MVGVNSVPGNPEQRELLADAALNCSSTGCGTYLRLECSRWGGVRALLHGQSGSAIKVTVLRMVVPSSGGTVAPLGRPQTSIQLAASWQRLCSAPQGKRPRPRRRCINPSPLALPLKRSCRRRPFSRMCVLTP